MFSGRHRVSWAVISLIFAIISCVKTRSLTPEEEIKSFAAKRGGEWKDSLLTVGKDYNLLRRLRSLSPGALRLIRRIAATQLELESVPPLDFLPSLDWLSLGRDFRDITALGGLNIKYLYLNGNPLANVAPLAECIKLEYLNLSFTEIEKMPDFSRLSNLIDIVLADTPMRSLSGIEHIPSDFNLNIMGCTELRDIDALRSARVNTLFIDQETYNRFKQWFDSNLVKIKMKRQTFNIRFTMTE